MTDGDDMPRPALASLEAAAGAEGPPPRELWRSEAVRGSLDRCYGATAAAAGRDRRRSGRALRRTAGRRERKGRGPVDDTVHF